jgi:hypothetical protein
MNLELTIGINSDATEFVVDLINQPNLFISYSEEYQLYQYFNNIILQFQNKYSSQEVQFAYALSYKSANGILNGMPDNFFFAKFIRNEYREGFIESKLIFWRFLYKEFKRRSSKLKTNKYNAQGDKKIIILIDDIFELVLKQAKKSGFYFLEMAVYGEHVGMHFITASYGAYRNLLIQLIQIHPLIEQKITNNYNNPIVRIANPIGSEIILNVDGLIFYKEKSNPDMRRLFPRIDPKY